MIRTRELELKLEAEPGGLAEVRDHPLLRNGSPGTTRTSSVYYDTSNGQLRKAGATLRVRQSGERFVQTIKANARPAAGLFDRAEWEERISGLEPDLRLIKGTALEPLLQREKTRRDLRPIFETIVNRQSWDVTHEQAEIEVILDEGEVVAGKRRQPLVELEFELRSGPTAALFSLARALQSSAPLRLGVLTKSEQGVRLANGKAARLVKAEPVRLARAMNVAEGFQTIALACIRHFRLNEPLVTALRDPGALHQSRVALRRLRSLFSMFRPVLAGDRFEMFREELRAVSAILGEARDLDVFIDGRKGSLRGLPKAKLLDARERAYDDVIRALAARRFGAMTIDLVEWIAIGPWLQADAALAVRPGAPLAPFAETSLDRYWRKVKRGGRKIKRLDDEARHELRIAGKKLRYGSEFFAALYQGRKMAAQRDTFVAALERLQADLGGLNDQVTGCVLAEKLSAQLGLNLDGRTKAGARVVSRAREKLITSAELAYDDLAAVAPFWR